MRKHVDPDFFSPLSNQTPNKKMFSIPFFLSFFFSSSLKSTQLSIPWNLKKLYIRISMIRIWLHHAIVNQYLILKIENSLLISVNWILTFIFFFINFFPYLTFTSQKPKVIARAGPATRSSDVFSFLGFAAMKWVRKFTSETEKCNNSVNPEKIDIR